MIGFNQFKNTKKAVSEIVGTLLILGMSVSLFSVLYAGIFSTEPTTPSPNVSIIGYVDGNNIVLEHRSGEPLPLDTKILLDIGGELKEIIIGDYLKDFNLDGLWNIGEKILYNHANLNGLQLKATVVDKESNSIIMMGTLQKGITIKNPYVINKRYYNLRSDSVTLEMRYDFLDKTGNIFFQIKKCYQDWDQAISRPYPPIDASGFKNDFNFTITGLQPRTCYDFRGVLKYEGKEIYGVPPMHFTTTGVVVGRWHFDEGVGRTVFDDTIHDNDGTLYPTGQGPLWVSGINSTGLSFDGIDDYVNVPDSNSLDVSKDITIEAWFNNLAHSEGKYGEIEGQIDNSQLGFSNCYEPDFIKVSDNVYAIACRDYYENGFVVTVGIADNGLINRTNIDILEFETTKCLEPDIIHIKDNYYAIAYRGPNDDGWIKTVNISSNGEIVDNFVDKLEFNNALGVDPSIVHVNDTFYAVAYRGPENDGHLTTVNIADDGNTIGIIETVKFDIKEQFNCEEFKIIHIDGSIFAIAYRNPDEDGEIRTVKIEDGDIIGQSYSYPEEGYYVNNYVFDGFDGWTPDIIHLHDDVYAVAYGGFEKPDTDGYLTTLTIDNSGVIAFVDSYEFNTQFSKYLKIIPVKNTIYAIAYSGVNHNTNHGYLNTVEILDDGTIIKNVISSYTFDNSNSANRKNPDIICIKDNVFALIYTGPNDDGILKTIKISDSGIINSNYIDIHEIGVFDFELPDIINIDNNVYAMAYKGIDGDGFVKTFEVQNDGDIAENVIDCIRFHKGEILDPKLVHVNGNLYAVAYSNQTPDSVWHGIIKTITINDDGSFDGEKFEFEFDGNRGIRPDIININGNIFAFVYRGVGDDGFINTVNIANDGTITTINSNPVEFEGSYCVTPDIYHIDAQIYAVAYRGPSNHGYIKTLTIENDGTIDISAMQSKKFDNSYCCYPEIIKVSGNIYAITYTGPSTDGWVKTVKIDVNGDILDSDVDDLEFDNYYSYRPDIIHVKDRVFAVTYTRWEGDGYLKTFRIGENGNITDLDKNNQLDDYLMFDSSMYKYTKCRLIHIHDDVYAVAHRRNNNDFIIRTIKISYIQKARPILSKSKDWENPTDAYTIKANSTKVFAYINSKELTADISPGFNFIVVTYNSSSNKMILYVNNVLKSQRTFDENIKTNSEPLLFGGSNSIIDEITLYEVVITEGERTQHWNDFKSNI